MAAPNRSTCTPWATTDEVCSGPCSAYDFDQVLLEDSLQVASDILFELSGRQFPGVCSQTVYPCSQSHRRDPWPDRTTSSFGLAPTPSCGCGPRDDCGCGGLTQIELGVVPVVAVTEVKVDGVVLAPSSYRIDEYRYLVRTDGEPFPCCSDLSDLSNAFTVTFDYGNEPPPAGVRAAAELACQLAMSCTPAAAGDCKLPQRVTSITRQGVSMVLLDPQTFLQNGKTGLYLCDLFLSAYNRHANLRPAAVYSPDLPRRARRANT